MVSKLLLITVTWGSITVCWMMMSLFCCALVLCFRPLSPGVAVRSTDAGAEMCQSTIKTRDRHLYRFVTYQQ